MKDLLRCPPSLPPFFREVSPPPPAHNQAASPSKRRGGDPLLRDRGTPPHLWANISCRFFSTPGPGLPSLFSTAPPSPGSSSVARSAMNISWLVPSSLYFLPPPSILFNLRARPLVRPPRRSAPGDKFLHLRLLPRMVSGSSSRLMVAALPPDKTIFLSFSKMRGKKLSFSCSFCVRIRVVACVRQ